MGQYYKPVSLDKKQYLYTHDFKSFYKREDGTKVAIGQGMKLMEHSYLGNPIMNAVENLLIPTGAWHKNRIVWAGDYADPEPDVVCNGEEEANLFDLIEEGQGGEKIHPSTKSVRKIYHFLVNHSKKEFIDLNDLKKDKDGYTIHPLSLLTSEGNGRGGGDFRGEDKRIGTWARDIISLEETVPADAVEVSGHFEE